MDDDEEIIGDTGESVVSQMEVAELGACLNLSTNGKHPEDIQQFCDKVIKYLKVNI